MQLIEYEVVNWSKYNPRSNVKKLSWYRQEVGIFDHPEYEHLTVGAKLMYYLLMDTAAKRHGIGKTTVRHVHRHTRLKQHRIKETLSHFEHIGLIKINIFGDKDSKTNPCTTERNGTRRNGTEQNKTKQDTPVVTCDISTRAHIDPTPPEKKLERWAVEGATRTIAAIHECGPNVERAQAELGADIWEILTRRFPKNTWANFCTAYQQAIKREKESYFLFELRKHFEAFIPLLAQRHGPDPPLPPESA